LDFSLHFRNCLFVFIQLYHLPGKLAVFLEQKYLSRFNLLLFIA
jgi:hypothetical protein